MLQPLGHSECSGNIAILVMGFVFIAPYSLLLLQLCSTSYIVHDIYIKCWKGKDRLGERSEKSNKNDLGKKGVDIPGKIKRDRFT